VIEPPWFAPAVQQLALVLTDLLSSHWTSELSDLERADLANLLSIF